MAKLSQAKKLKRLEQIIIGAGFLLQQVRNRYGADMPQGMISQMHSCLRDCNQVSRTVAEREARENSKEAT